MKVKFLLLSTLIAFLLFGCGKDEMEGYKTYENDTHGFSIQYPEEWTYREGLGKDSESGVGAIVVFQSPKEGKKDLFRENAYIFTEELPDSVTNVDEYLDYSKYSLPEQMKEFEILSEGEALINGEKSKWIIFSYVSRMQKSQSLAYMFYKDGQGFVFTSTARPNTLMSFRRLFENMSTSIKFDE